MDCDWKLKRKLRKAAIEKRVRQLGEMSGIGRRVYPHLIRHTTATDGLFRGMPVEEVQKLLGHVNITMQRVAMYFRCVIKTFLLILIT